MSVLSNWKDSQSSNFAGSFLVSIQDLGILFSLIGQSVELKFPFFQEKSGLHNFLDSPTNDIFSSGFQEKFKKRLNKLNRVFIEFYRFFINLASVVTRFAHPWFKVSD
jgi:hypothetical protein